MFAKQGVISYLNETNNYQKIIELNKVPEEFIIKNKKSQKNTFLSKHFEILVSLR